MSSYLKKRVINEVLSRLGYNAQPFLTEQSDEYDDPARKMRAKHPGPVGFQVDFLSEEEHLANIKSVLDDLTERENVLRLYGTHIEPANLKSKLDEFIVDFETRYGTIGEPFIQTIQAVISAPDETLDNFKKKMGIHNEDLTSTESESPSIKRKRILTLLSKVIEGLEEVTNSLQNGLRQKLTQELKRAFKIGTGYNAREFLGLNPSISTSKPKLRSGTPSDTISNHTKLYRDLEMYLAKAGSDLTPSLLNQIRSTIREIQNIERRYKAYS